MEYARLLQLPATSFFLFGPRGVGKSYWLRKAAFADVVLDLLRTDLSLELLRGPASLERRIGDRPEGAWVWIDEVQKVPSLLDEVHRLIETRHWRFSLSGSSARKLRRHGGNLLGGRAVERRMEAFVSREMGADFDIRQATLWGTLPLVAKNYDAAADVLQTYVHTYLREEIREEGLVRKVEPFVRFIEVAGLLNGQQLNASGIARQAMLPRASVDTYFSILEDTLVGHRLPAYQPKTKIQEHTHPKFYWFDPGVARAAAGLLRQPVDSLWLGAALETVILHEMRVHNETSGKHHAISYYRSKSGVEIDFIVEIEKATLSRPATVVCVEVKSATRWDRAWERSIREFGTEGGIKVARRLAVYLGDTPYQMGDLAILPVAEFLARLHDGRIF